MVDNNPVTNRKVTNIFTDPHDLPARFMPGDHVIIAGTTFTIVGIINL